MADDRSVIVVSPHELRAIVGDAVREALHEDRRDRPPDSDTWLDTAAVAQLLDVHPRTVTKAAQHGDLLHKRLGKLYRFRHADVMEYLERSSGRDTNDQRTGGNG